MFRLIARLQQKTMPERRRIAFVVALLITAAIALMWVIWLTRGGITERVQEKQPTVTPAEGLWLPFKRVVGSFAEAFERLKMLSN